MYDVDDCMSGKSDWNKAMSVTDEIKLVLALKGFTFPGHDPPERLSDDGNSIKVAGMKWYPKEDILQLCIGEINFSKKKRGK